MTSIRDRGLKRTFAPMTERLEQGQQLNGDDIQALMTSALDGPGVTKTEAKDLAKILDVHGQDMDPTARATLASFIEAQTQGSDDPAVNALNFRIKNAGIRKALTGEDGNPAILEDSVVSSSEAQRLLDIVNNNGIISGREKRDLKTLLSQPDVTISGSARRLLEEVAGTFVEPAPHLTQSGASIASAHVDSGATYRKTSVPMNILAQAGVSSDVIALMNRADGLSGSGDASGSVSIDELLALEQNGALLPAEKALLPKIYALLEVQPVMSPATPAVEGLEIEDLSVRPSNVDVRGIAVDVSDLPADLQTLAQRARLIHTGDDDDLGQVTIANVRYAIANDHGESTADDRARMESELLPALQPLAVRNAGGEPLSAKAIVPDLGTTSNTLVSNGDLKLTFNTTTSLTGTMSQRGSWSPMVKSHRRGSVARYPSAIPKSTDVSLTLARENTLDVEIPAGHKLMLVGKDTTAGRHAVFSPGARIKIGADLTPGDYRAVLMKDGAVVEESALRLAQAKAQTMDASALYGFDLETKSGESVGIRRTSGSSYNGTLAATVGGSNNLPGSDVPVTLETGRYAGSVKIAYNDNRDFTLDVLPNNVLEMTMDDKTFRLFVIDKSPTVYEGHFDDEGTAHTVMRFDPRNNTLTAIEEKMDTWHGSTGWHAEVEARSRDTVTIIDSMRAG